MPYALLYEKGAINGMDAPPLIIQYNNLESKISLDTSKFITNKLETIIDTKKKPVLCSYTQVQSTIPKGQLSHDFPNELKDYYLNYTIFSTHIKYDYDFNGEKFSTPDDAMTPTSWTNQITAWAYTDNEFYVFVENLIDQSETISKILGGWRELKWLPDGWKQKRLNELSKEQKIGLLNELKSRSTPMKKLSVPYGGNKESDELRKAVLIKRIAAIYDVDEKYAEYKVVRARYISPDGIVNFPYVFEVIVIPFDDIWNNYPIFVGSVNNSVSIINRGKSLYDGAYRFIDKGRELTAWNMDGILERWYGYRVRDSSKSWPCVIACNLLTPKVEGRGEINICN